MQENPNITYIKELSGDDTVFEQEFISILKNEFPIEKNSYLDHIEKNQVIAAAEIVHKLKHKLNILSMMDSYRFAVTYEEELRSQNLRMDTGFRKILETIENYLKTI